MTLYFINRSTYQDTIAIFANCNKKIEISIEYIYCLLYNGIFIMNCETMIKKYVYSANNADYIAKELNELSSTCDITITIAFQQRKPENKSQLVDTSNVKWKTLCEQKYRLLLKQVPALANELDSEMKYTKCKSLCKFIKNVFSQGGGTLRYDLEYLSVGYREFSSIPEEIEFLTCLKTVYLNHTGLTDIPRGIGKLVNLTSLSLANNTLQTIPSEIGQLYNLTQLELQCNVLKTIPQELGKLTNLKTLFLNNNKLTTIPKELGLMISLRTLYLYSNQLESIPEELGQLTNLENLSLQDNQLPIIPKEICRLATLKNANFSKNQLETVPHQLYHLTKLTQLHLNNNKLQTISKDIGQLTNITELNLNDNQFRVIPPEINKLTNLINLYLGNNQLETMPELSLEYLSKLKNCYFAGNENIKFVPYQLIKFMR